MVPYETAISYFSSGNSVMSTGAEVAISES
jgi:hypothetical protein